MKASKEYKNWVKRLVKKFGKKNGNVRGALWDNPEMERKDATDKHKRILKDTSWKSDRE